MSAQTKDSSIYRNRLNLYQSNSFFSNNNNPFLISPFQFPSNVASETSVIIISSIVSQISSVISTLIGNLSSVINIETYTLCISTIVPCPPPNNTITIDSAILNVTGNSYFDYISSGTIYSNTLYSNTINFTTLTGSTITTNELTVNSTINASTITSKNINFTTLIGSTITTNELTISSINMNPGSFSSIITSTFVSSIYINIGGNSYIIPVLKV